MKSLEDVQKMGGVNSQQTDTYPKEKFSIYFLHAEYIKKSIHHSLFFPPRVLTCIAGHIYTDYKKDGWFMA